MQLVLTPIGDNAFDARNAGRETRLQGRQETWTEAHDAKSL